MIAILTLILNFIPICYFIMFLGTGIFQQFQSGDPAEKMFFYTTFYELLILIVFCLALSMMNMKLIYENNNNKP